MSHVPEGAVRARGGVPTATTLLLVVPAGADASGGTDARRPEPTNPDGCTAWAVALHDELASRDGPPTRADLARVGSWLRVQAIGAPVIAVVEPRCETFAPLWAEAARGAGLEAALVRKGRGGWRPVTVPDRGLPVAAEVQRQELPGRGHATRVWLADRAEGVARRVVRLVQR